MVEIKLLRVRIVSVLKLHFILKMKEKSAHLQRKEKLKEIMPAEALSSLYDMSLGVGGMG